jgi:predicted Holliday junction resolvase-like endonuclease
VPVRIATLFGTLPANLLFMIELVLTLLVAGLILALLILFYRYSRLQARIEDRARTLFDGWQAAEQQRTDAWKAEELERRTDEKARILFAEWQAREEKAIRQDAVARSQAVTRGKVTEHLIPYFPEFAYNPKDARFLGTPVDFVVFDGLSDGDGKRVEQVVFVEVKSGRSAQLSARERAVRDAVMDGRIVWEVVRNVGE